MSFLKKALSYLSVLLGITAFFFFIKSAVLSLVYLYKVGGIFTLILGLLSLPFTVAFAPFFSGFQKGNWDPMVSGLAAIFCCFLCVLLAGLAGDEKKF
jgi:hypothetical protein